MNRLLILLVIPWLVSCASAPQSSSMSAPGVDLIDVAERRLVWQGSTRGRLTRKDMQNVQALLEEAVAEVFAEFPGR